MNFRTITPRDSPRFQSGASAHKSRSFHVAENSNGSSRSGVSTHPTTTQTESASPSIHSDNTTPRARSFDFAESSSEISASGLSTRPTTRLKQLFSGDTEARAECSNHTPQIEHVPHTTVSDAGRTTQEDSLPTVAYPPQHQAFFLELMALIRKEPRPPVHEIIDFHTSKPHLHTTATYNAVLSCAIQGSEWVLYQNLVASMQRSRILHNINTLRLEIRYLTRTGRWEDAWNRAHEYCEESQSSSTSSAKSQRALPRMIWMQLFSLPRPSKFPNDGEHDAFSGDDRNTWKRRVERLFQVIPTECANFADLKPHEIRRIVTFLTKLGFTQAALSITKEHFLSLPPILDARVAEECTAIINTHLNLSVRLSEGDASIRTAQNLLRSLLDLHPGLRPNSLTLFALLKQIRKVMNQPRGTLADKIVADFTKKWGEDMVDGRVRRRVATAAMDERNLKLARKYALAHEFAEIDGYTQPKWHGWTKGIGTDRRLWGSQRARLRFLESEAKADRSKPTS